MKNCAEPHCKKTVHNGCSNFELPRMVQPGLPAGHNVSIPIRPCYIRARSAAGPYHLLWRPPHEVGHDVDGQREDDGGVLLRGDARQGLQVAELGQGFFVYILALLCYFTRYMETGREKHIYGNLTSIF